MPKHISPRDVAIIARTEDGVTMDKVAAEYGITRQRVHQVLVKYGVTVRGGDQVRLDNVRKRLAANEARQARRADRQKRNAEWASMYRRGESTYTIAAAYGVGAQTVYYALLRQRVKLRPQHVMTKKQAARISAGHARRREQMEAQAHAVS